MGALQRATAQKKKRPPSFTMENPPDDIHVLKKGKKEAGSFLRSKKRKTLVRLQVGKHMASEREEVSSKKKERELSVGDSRSARGLDGGPPSRG